MKKFNLNFRSDAHGRHGSINVMSLCNVSRFKHEDDTKTTRTRHELGLYLHRYVATLLVLLMAGFGQAWGDTSETLTWDGKALAGSGGTNTSAGTVAAVNGSTYKAGSITISSSKIQTEQKKHDDDGYWEDFTCAACTTSTTTNATTTARLEFPITISDGYTFNVTSVGFTFANRGGGGPRVHAFLVQGATSTWVGCQASNGSYSNTSLNVDLSAGSAKLVLVLGVASNTNNGRGFEFSAISIGGTSASAIVCNADPADPDGLSAGSLTATGATFTITDDETPKSYDIYYSTSSTAPTGSTEATTTTTNKTKAVTGLTSGTTYYAWVRAVCDSYKSNWVALGGGTFTTKNQYTITYNKDGATESQQPNGTKTEGENFTLSSTRYTKSGKWQVGWATSSGGAKVYEFGGTYSSDANLTLYPAWVDAESYEFDYSDGKTISQLEALGWTFNSKTFDGDPTDGEAYVNLVSAMNTAGLTAPKSNSMEDNALAFAKTSSAYALFDIGEALKVYQVKLTLYGGSKDPFSGSVQLIGSDGSTVKQSETPSLSAGNWQSNTFTYTYTAGKADVQYIKIFGASKWIVMYEMEVIHEPKAAAVCPSAYSFHYGTDGQSDWTTECFTKVGDTHKWTIENFEIPDKPNFYVGWQGSDNAQTATKAWTDGLSDTGSGVMNGAMVLLPTNGSVVGNATGAIGTLEIWDNSSSLNQYVGFRPNGYSIKYSSTNHAFSTTTGDTLETSVLTLPSVSTTYTMEIATESSYVTCYHSKAAEPISEMGVSQIDANRKKILCSPGSYLDDGYKVALYDITAASFVGFMTDPDGDGVYEGYVPRTCKKIIITRHGQVDTPTWENKANQTEDISLKSDSLLIKYSFVSWGGTGKKETFSETYIHPATGEKGKFRMFSHYNANNWGVHWIPYNVLSYDGNGGTGSTTQTERNTESSTTTVTVASNGFTAPTGYTFKGWATSDSRADAGTVDYAAGASYTLTSNDTLYAAWNPITYSITYKDQGGSAFSGSHADGYPTTHTYGSSTTLKDATKTGYTFGGWFGNSACTADPMTSVGATSYSTNFTLYAKWTIKTYTVTFVSNNDDYGTVDVASIASVPHGSEVDLDNNVLTLKETEVTASATTSTAAYTYAFDSWSVSEGAEITEAQTITATFTRTANSYDVTHSFTNVSRSSGGSDGTKAATYGTDYTVVVAATSGYSLPSSITVTIGEDEATENAEYTWDKSTGTVTIGGSYILGDIEIEITADPDVTTYSVTYSKGDATGGTAPSDATAYDSGDEVTVKDTTGCKFVYVGHTFRGWTDGTTFYLVGQKFNITSDVTLTAVWDDGASGGSYTYTFESSQPGNPLGTYFDITTSAGEGHSYEIASSLNSNSIKASDLTGGGSYFLGGTISTSGVSATYKTKASYINIDSIAFYENASDNGKPSYVFKVVDASTGTAQYTSSSLTHQTIKGSSGTNKWTGRYRLDLHSSPKTGKLQIEVTSGSSGKYYALDNITVYYKGDKSFFTVSFANMTGFGGSTTLPSNIVGVPSGKMVLKPSDPTAVGYTFSGWYSDAACTAGNEVNLSTMTVTADKTIYAKWCANHTVAWVVNGSAYSTGTPTTATTDCDGITTMPTAPADNTLSGCANSFRGWSATNLYGEATNTQPTDLFVTAANAPAINADKTFYAVFGTATSVAYVGTVLWSEDWTGESNNAKPSSPTTGGGYAIASGVEYDYVDGTGDNNATTKVATGTNAGGVSPELMVGFGTTTAGAFTVTGLPKKGAKELTLIFKRNNTTTSALTPSVTGEGYSISKVSGSGAGTYVYTITCGAGSTFDLIFTGSTTKDKSVRIDDIVLKVKTDGATNYRCICPSLEVTEKLVTASTPIFITSAASKTVRSQDSLRIVGSGLAKSATLSISSPASKFALKSGKNGTLTTDATGAIDTVAYIYYTPDAEDTSDGLDKNNSFTISDGTNTETVSTALIGRHLPANFVIAAKSDDKWYALPADNAKGKPLPVEITVDDADYPTTATTSEANVYTLHQQTSTVINGGNGQCVKLAMHGQDNAPLFGGKSDNELGKSGSSLVTSDLSAPNWWYFKQTNTSITNAADAKYYLHTANTANPVTLYNDAEKWGLYASGAKNVQEIRLIPWNEVYTLTWNTNGGSDLAGSYTSGSTAYGADITAPNDPTLSNYTFDGWKTNNDGTGTAKGSTMPAANTTYYAAWKQTVTLTTGAQGSGSNQTPVVYLNGTSVSDFTAHTASGYSLQGYYTAGSGGVKVLNADGSFAAANVTDYITSSKWSRTGAAPTLYAQWVASEDCSTSDFVIKKGSSTEYQGCMESSSYDGTATSFTAGSATTVGNAKMTISSYSKGAIARPGSGNTFSIVIEPVSGYYLKSICWAGKVESGETVSYYWDDDSESATTISAQTTSGTGVTYNAPSSTTKFTASYVDDGVDGGGIWWRNVQVEVCAAGGTTYSVTYDDNDATGGTAPTDTDSPYDYGTTVTVLGNTGPLEKTNYTFAGWSTNNDGTGSNYVADNTFSITANTTLYAKWTQAVTFDANTANHGSTGGSATAVWNATGLTGITHATPASGYKLLGYYTAATSGTKVLNSDGSFAATAADGYVTDGKWSRTDAAATLYAQYESAGALTWNLIVNSDTANLSTSTKTSAFTEISTTNMTNAALTGLTYTKSSKSSLTGKIEVLSSEDAAKYASVSFQVASGYKFIPSSAKVIIQPVETSNSDVKIILSDGTRTITQTKDNLAKGKKDTVTLTNSDADKYMMGTVTLKIYVYGASSETYRLGTPITIEGEIEEACGTMPSYSSMSYSQTDYTEGDSPSAITIVGGTNITTYAWKQNTTNDRSGGSAASGTNNEPSYTPPTSSAGTTYYWCEMTNTSCGITIQTPAVAINVSASKSTASVTWDPKAKYDDGDTTAYYGGKNYTLKATLNSGWDGTLTEDMFTAPSGIRLHDFTIDNSSNPKTITATFDVQTTFNIAENDSIDFTLSLPATTTYNALSSEKKVAYNECSGSGEGATYNLKVRKTTTKDGNYYYWANTDGWISMNPNSSFSSEKASSTYEGYDSVYNTNGQQVFVRTYHANINKVRIYADFRANNMTVSNVYKHTTYFSAESKYEISADDYTAVYNGDEENTNLGDAANGYVDIILNKAMSENDILLVKFSTAKVRPYGAKLTESSAGSLTTSLAWSNSLSDGATVNKTQSSANFTYTASPTSDNSNTLGSITYTSSNTSCATVNATTGEVTITATGTSDLSTTITATLAASGCYKGKTITYTISVPGVTCTVTTGTLTSDVTSKCSTVDATLTLTGFESGATLQWYKGESTISDDATYDISDDGTTLVTKEAGTYSVMVTNSAETCSDRSNSITISNISATASVTKIVDEWYVKNGRLTPDIALWTMSEGTTLESVTWDDTNETGLSCYARDGVIYLEGKEPSSNESGADIEYTLMATILDACGGSHEETTKTIKITHQKNTDKHVLAFVVEGTAKGGFTAGITAAQTTDVDLYNTIATNFDVLATNIYSTDDEKKLKEYYSQFDILCITDYPNTKTKGVNSKSYVDAMGALVDIRPILTMEAWVSGLTNWKAKGISGTPSSPTTRQYTMLLQCKDHEIFSGTKLTKVGEGDETMYRISMVCDTLEDYKTLDATYGSGTHESDKNYQYGKKPALQGFTFDATMADDGLLPLGRIDDGAGNDLEVGIERQTEMEARLMVLGINSYAMERLTDDGQTVVVNALKYLMKKNSEDIADCSNTFVGGAEGDEKNWNNAANWSGNAIPERTQKVRIVAPCVIKADEKFHVTGVVIAPSGKYNHGANTANGSLTIAAGGALIVDGKVEAATAPLYTETRATTPTDLILKTNSTAQSALIFDNEDGETQATVNYYSKGHYSGGHYQFQYFALPVDNLPISPTFANKDGKKIWTFAWSEPSNNWERRGYYDDFYAFEALAITSTYDAALNYTLKGNLASTAEREITLTHSGEGTRDNMIGNSWTAPINIGALVDAFDGDSKVEKTVYIYCAGNDTTDGDNAEDFNTVETAGQWLSIPMGLATFPDWDGLKVIPSMQAYMIRVTGETTLTLDYSTMVRSTSTSLLNEKLRAPRRTASHADKELTRLRVRDSKTLTDLYLVTGDCFSDAFDNGWEASYKEPEGASPQFYAMGERGKMSILATDELEGTMVGFKPGQETEHTITFSGAGNGYYLNDIKLKKSTLIEEGNTYRFTYEKDDDENRFYISATPIDAPQMPTGYVNPDAEAPKVQKIIYNDKLYIIRSGRVYDATGAMVK